MATTFAFTVMNWNLQNFGNYQKSSGLNWIADVIIEYNVDIVLIEEMVVNRGPKRVKIGEEPPLQQGITAGDDLLSTLQSKDKKAGWDSDYTGASCSNKDRDAYLILYRQTPAKSTHKITPPAGTSIPKKISLNNIDIFSSGPTKKRKLGFEGSRRPGGAQFVFTDNSNNEKSSFILAFHAYAPDGQKSITNIKNSIKDCLLAAENEADSTPTTGNSFIVGGDLNLDYNTESAFYNGLKTTNDQPISVAITTKGESTLMTTINSNNKYKTANAYDNILFYGVNKLAGPPAKIIDVIYEQAKKTDKPPSTNQLKTAFNKYRTQFGGVVSDHLPAIASFSI